MCSSDLQMTAFLIQRGGIARQAVPQYHSLDPVIRPWTMNPDAALQFARYSDAAAYLRCHLAAGHAVVPFVPAGGAA